MLNWIKENLKIIKNSANDDKKLTIMIVIKDKRKQFWKIVIKNNSKLLVEIFVAIKKNIFLKQ